MSTISQSLLHGKLKVAYHLLHNWFVDGHPISLSKMMELCILGPTFLCFIFAPITSMYANIKINIFQLFKCDGTNGVLAFPFGSMRRNNSFFMVMFHLCKTEKLLMWKNQLAIPHSHFKILIWHSCYMCKMFPRKKSKLKCKDGFKSKHVLVLVKGVIKVITFFWPSNMCKLMMPFLLHLLHICFDFS